MRTRTIISFNLLVVMLFFYGCAYVKNSATSGLAANLKNAVMNYNDLETVEAGGPAYLLMIDALLLDDPGNEKLLTSAASLYSAYNGVFVADAERARRLTEKARGYGLRVVCIRRAEACRLDMAAYDEFEATIAAMGKDDVPALYALGAAWAGWIQARRDDLNAVAQLARVEAIMDRVVELDESYQQGSAHIYLGVLSCLAPPSMGGRPEAGRRHFERAIQLSEGRNLMAKVSFAESYARLVFDRELHDRLLNQVLTADPDVPGYTLINTYARRKAQQLLDSADAYF
jgi:hypothetical protein